MKKRYTATVYLIQKNGSRQVYDTGTHHYKWTAWLFIWMALLSVGELTKMGICTADFEILPA